MSNRNMGSTNQTKRPYGRVLLSVSVLIVCVGLSLEMSRHALAEQMYQKVVEKVEKEIVWKKDSPKAVRERFTGDDGKEMEVKVYMMNITNVADVRLGDRPILQEVGPYVFHRKKQKGYVEFSKDNSTVRFKEGSEYRFVRNISVGGLDDEVLTLNIPLVGALEVIMAHSPSRLSPMLQLFLRILDSWADKSITGIFMKRTVDDLLFGYSDPLLSKISRVVPGFSSHFQLLHNISLENGDEMEMKTGWGDALDDVGQMQVWKGVENVSAWENAEQVRGTNGMQFAPSLRPEGILKPKNRAVWVGEVYRAVSMVPDGENVRQLNGVPFVRLIPDPSTFEASQEYDQQYEGLMNITRPVAMGLEGRASPTGPYLFLSLPGYCKVSSKMVTKSVQGIACDPERHQIFLDIDEPTGITIRERKTLMLSSWFGESYSVIEPSVRDTFLPIFWAEETSEASKKQLQKLSKLHTILHVHKFLTMHAHSLAIGCLVVGIPIILAVFLISSSPRQQLPWTPREEEVLEEGEAGHLIVASETKDNEV